MFIEKTLEKFNADKTYKYFPGNTIIQFIDDIDPIINIKETLVKSNLFDKFVFLPNASYHMTVCDLITFNDLKTNPAFSEFVFKEENAIDIIDKKIIDTFKKEVFNLNIEMKPVKIKAKQILLKPNTKEDEDKLKEFRNNIQELLKIKLNPNYNFHISLSYQLKKLTDDEQQQIDEFLEDLNADHLSNIGTIKIDQPILAAFNDMYEYRLLSKGRKELGFNGL